MGKDKYSDDHTIEVAGGTNTVNISGNLNVSGELAAGGGLAISGDINSVNLEVTNDLTVGNDLDVGNDLTVDADATITGTLTVDGPTTISNDLSITGGSSVTSSNYFFTSDISVQRVASIFDLHQSVNETGTNTTSTLVTPTGDYVSIEVGSSINDQWYFFFPIDNLVINNADLTSANFLLELKTNHSGNPTYDFEVSLLSFSDGDLTPPTLPSTIGSDTFTFLPTAGRQWYSASLSATIASEPLGSAKSYYLKFRKIGPGTGSVSIYIYRCVIRMDVPSVSLALNKV